MFFVQGRFGFLLVGLTAALAVGCSKAPSKGTGEASTDDQTTDGPGTDGPGTAGPATAGPATAGPATAGPSTAGPSTDGPATDGPVTDGPATDGPVTDGPVTDGPVTDGPVTEGVGETEGATEGSTEGETEGSTEGTGVPVSYAACSDGTADACPVEDPLCVKSDGPGGGGTHGSFGVSWSFCTRFCETNADCATDIVGGSATSVCKDYRGQNICMLDCSFGQSCPPGGYQCGYNNACGIHHCRCSGSGCSDPSCQSPP